MGPKKNKTSVVLLENAFVKFLTYVSALFPKEEDIGYLVVRPKLVLFSAVNTDCLKSYFSFYDDVKKDLLYRIELYNFWISFSKKLYVLINREHWHHGGEYNRPYNDTQNRNH